MSAQANRQRTKRSYGIQLGLEAAIWTVNLYQIATRFHTMSFTMAASAVMLFLLVPVSMWQALNGLRKETA